MRTVSATASFALLLAAAASAPASARGHGGGVAAPPLEPGDSWTYEDGQEVRGTIRTSHDVITLVRADRTMIIVNVKAAGATGPGREQIIGPEWSRVRSVNGQQTTVNRPLAYPLTQGKTWAVDYSEATPADRTHLRETWHTTYKVGSWEDVSVPAGTFRALRIEADGTWTADLPANVAVTRGRAPNGSNVAMATAQGARTASGRVLKTFWYVPAVRRWVKSEEDVFDSNGTRTGHATSTLEAYALAGQGHDDWDADAAAADGPDDAPDEAAPPKHAGSKAAGSKAAKEAGAREDKPAGTHHPAAVAAPPEAPAPAQSRPVQPTVPTAPLLQELRWQGPRWREPVRSGIADAS